MFSHILVCGAPKPLDVVRTSLASAVDCVDAAVYRVTYQTHALSSRTNFTSKSKTNIFTIALWPVDLLNELYSEV